MTYDGQEGPVAIPYDAPVPRYAAPVATPISVPAPQPIDSVAIVSARAPGSFVKSCSTKCTRKSNLFMTFFSSWTSPGPHSVGPRRSTVHLPASICQKCHSAPTDSLPIQWCQPGNYKIKTTLFLTLRVIFVLNQQAIQLTPIAVRSLGAGPISVVRASGTAPIVEA